MARTITLVALPGVLRGNGLEATCEVEVEEVSTWNRLGFREILAYGKHEIVSVDGNLPGGRYQLSVHDATYNLVLFDGNWMADR